jgi:hypothetical protein
LVTVRSRSINWQIIVNQKRNGFFVEIGGYDGETFSNSLLLEKERRWSGLLVEANP